MLIKKIHMLDSMTKKTNVVEEEFTYGLMALNTLVTGRMGRPMVKDGKFMLMVIAMRANGKMTKQMVMEHMSLFMGKHYRVSGEMHFCMGEGVRYGRIYLITKENMSMVSNKAKEYSNGQTEVNM